MCYYIGIEDLAANALIEIVDKTGNRKIGFRKLNEYGAFVVNQLKANNKEAILLLSRDRTNEFIHNCTEFFEVDVDDNGDSFISLKENISTDQLRSIFRVNISLNVLFAFIDASALQVLGVV